MSNPPSAAVTTEIRQQTRATIQLHQADSNTVAGTQLPSATFPSSDPRLVVDNGGAVADKPADNHVIFKMLPSEALRMLSANVELLVRLTGDVPPTPPPKSPTVPHMSGMQAEKENIARSHSDKNLAMLLKQAELEAKKLEGKNSHPSADSDAPGHANNSPAHGEDEIRQNGSEAIDGVQLKQSPEFASASQNPAPYIIVGADSQPINLQHGAITRKFYSKNEPPISINQYLLRLHQFCPMSTAVYLATSLYIYRLAVEERAIPVTRRNAHRLVLAGLRVAMKALEDLSYPHSKMAKVGGVSEAELARLEISFCFLAGFELVVGLERLQDHYDSLKAGAAERALVNLETPILTLSRKPREQAQTAG